MQRLKPAKLEVMFDYCATALWYTPDGEVYHYNADYDEFDLSSELVNELKQWTKDMDDLLWPADRDCDRKITKVEKERLKQLNNVGLALAKRVKQKLSSDWFVQYFDHETAERIDLT